MADCWKAKTRLVAEPGLELLGVGAESDAVRLHLSDTFGLGTFLPLRDFEFYFVTLLKAFVAIRLDGAVVNKNIRAIVSANESEALCVVEPLHFTFNSRHDPCSISVPGALTVIVARNYLSQFFWDCHGLRKGRRHLELQTTPAGYVFLPATLAFHLFSGHSLVLSI